MARAAKRGQRLVKVKPRTDFMITLSVDEKEVLRAAAERAGLPLATWIRVTALDAARKG